MNLSQNDRDRLVILHQVTQAQVSVSSGARRVGLSVRQSPYRIGDRRPGSPGAQPLPSLPVRHTTITTLLLVIGISLAISFICSILEVVLLSISHSYVAILQERGHPVGDLLARMRARHASRWHTDDCRWSRSLAG
ncbi:hypothetical protein BH23GEM6_BH23GEM6_26800 [soil metagenome]